MNKCKLFAFGFIFEDGIQIGSQFLFNEKYSTNFDWFVLFNALLMLLSGALFLKTTAAALKTAFEEGKSKVFYFSISFWASSIVIAGGMRIGLGIYQTTRGDFQIVGPCLKYVKLGDTGILEAQPFNSNCLNVGEQIFIILQFLIPLTGLIIFIIYRLGSIFKGKWFSRHQSDSDKQRSSKRWIRALVWSFFIFILSIPWWFTKQISTDVYHYIPPSGPKLLILGPSHAGESTLYPHWLLDLHDYTTNRVNLNYYNKTEFAFDGVCAVNYNGEFYMIGGNNLPRQMSRLKGCNLEYKNQIPFDYSHGSCGIFDFGLLLCFGSPLDNACYLYSDEKFTKLNSTSHYVHHGAGHNLVKYKNGPFITGGVTLMGGMIPIPSSSMTEIMNFENGDGIWTVQEPYPYGENIGLSSFVSLKKEVLVIGGSEWLDDVFDYAVFDRIASFNGSWSIYGKLMSARSGHNSILFKSKIFIVGDQQKTEIFDLENKNSTMTDPFQ